jgi:hypothetical protein
VEGHVNGLKTIKRQMYGRAGFVLLRARVLNAAFQKAYGGDAAGTQAGGVIKSTGDTVYRGS